MDLTDFIDELLADQQRERWKDGTQVVTVALLHEVLDKTFIHDLECQLQLLFIHERDSGNTCFATYNIELQDDYKQTFEISDVWYSLYGVLFEREETEEKSTSDQIFAVWNTKITLGEDAFWKLVQVGKEALATRRIRY